jgi:hypothetical protein
MKKRILISAMAFAALASLSIAQPYVTGQVTTPNWNPGTGAPTGGGTAADMTIVAGAGVDANGIAYSHSLTLPGMGAVSHGLTAATNYEWKVADVGFTGINFRGNNSHLRVGAVATTPISFYARIAPFGDGLLPEAGGANLAANQGYLWSSQTAELFAPATSWNVLGNFTSELGGADWTASQSQNPVLTDAGFGAASDGIWGATVTGLAPGTYACKFFDNNDFGTGAPEVGNDGYRAGSDFSFTVLSASDSVKFILDTRTARGGVDVDSVVVIQPGIYATSSAWATTFDNATVMNFHSVAGVRSRTFTVATAGAYSVRVRRHDGNAVAESFPESGDYPFVTTAANQQVTVFLDTNTYGDGFLPANNIVTVVDPTTRGSLFGTVTEVQLVGNIQSEIDSLGLVGDFTNNDDLYNLTETGVGTRVFSGVFAHGNAGSQTAPVTSVQYKAVGRFPDTASIQTSGDWSIQFGGAGEGTTLNGNNDNLTVSGSFAPGNSFATTVDILTGRMSAVIGTTAPAAPARPAYLLSATSVEDWMNF